jgi:hypothetical protein
MIHDSLMAPKSHDFGYMAVASPELAVMPVGSLTSPLTKGGKRGVLETRPFQYPLAIRAR